ncbi:MAG: hypothetical protein BMS9Abin24_097 [Thermodesulfobacteriota bacterium]|nr:MAG: hypothetical protein BMS9Abin24_097 [Thermodesulfobacteriota bacterium]
MAAPSKSYTDISDSQVDADSPLDTILMTSLRDNVVHIKEWVGGSYAAQVDHDHDGVNSKPISGLLYAAGDDVLVAADTARTESTGAYVKKKEIQMLRGGNLRVKFDLKSDNLSKLAYGQIYKNGVAEGTLQSTNTTSYVTFTEDLAGWVTGDLVQLYVKIETPAFVAFVANFRICVSHGVVNID